MSDSFYPPESLQQVAQTIQVSIAALQKAFAEIAADAINSLNRIPGELRPVMRSLADLGWFPSGEMGMSEIHAFKGLIEAEKNDAINCAMIDWLQAEIPGIQKRLARRFANRWHILQAAFTAHAAGQFELSVPVFLAQVEGMCLEILGTKLFSTEKGVPRTRGATDALIRFELSEVLLLPLRELHGLTANEASRSKWPDAPNRHEILHGISTDYATSTNSYKAISLLEYFTTFVAPKFDADRQ